MSERKKNACVLKSKKTWYAVNSNDYRIQFNKAILALKQILIQFRKELKGTQKNIPYLVIRAGPVARPVEGSEHLSSNVIRWRWGSQGTVITKDLPWTCSFPGFVYKMNKQHILSFSWNWRIKHWHSQISQSYQNRKVKVTITVTSVVTINVPIPNSK